MWHIIKYHQVVFCITGKSVFTEVKVDVSKTAVSICIVSFVKILSGKKCCFGALQHIAVHAIGAEHNILLYSFRIEKTHFIVHITFGVLCNPHARFFD